MIKMLLKNVPHQTQKKSKNKKSYNKLRINVMKGKKQTPSGH
jgi:hypothetical protein